MRYRTGVWIRTLILFAALLPAACAPVGTPLPAAQATPAATRIPPFPTTPAATSEPATSGPAAVAATRGLSTSSAGEGTPAAATPAVGTAIAGTPIPAGATSSATSASVCCRGRGTGRPGSPPGHPGQRHHRGQRRGGHLARWLSGHPDARHDVHSGPRAGLPRDPRGERPALRISHESDRDCGVACQTHPLRRKPAPSPGNRRQPAARFASARQSHRAA